MKNEEEMTLTERVITILTELYSDQMGEEYTWRIAGTKTEEKTA